MKDIVYKADGKDLALVDTQNHKAANILSVQIGALEYIPEFGIDIRYFLTQGVEFQDESFRAYLVQRLADFGINVQTVTETVENLYSRYIFELSRQTQSDGLVG